MRSKAILAGIVLLVAVTGTLSSSLIAWSGPAPPVYTYPNLYRLDDGHWRQSLLFEPGDRIRLVMPFLTIQPGWSSPRGILRIQRDYAQRVVFKHTMDRRRGAHGYTIFSLTFQLSGRQWIGHWMAEADVTNGTGSIVPNITFAVLPQLPRLFRVTDAISLCLARSSLTEAITVGGIFSARARGTGATPGWLAEGRWAGRGSIPNWWKHGVLKITFPSATWDTGGPPDGFMQVRARLNCAGHKLTAVARPFVS